MTTRGAGEHCFDVQVIILFVSCVLQAQGQCEGGVTAVMCLKRC